MPDSTILSRVFDWAKEQTKDLPLLGKGDVREAIKKEGWGTLERARRFLKHIDSVNTSKGIPGTDAFDSYLKNRPAYAITFAAIKGSDGKPLGGKLRGAEQLQNDIRAALKSSEDIAGAKSNFDQHLSYLNKQLQQDPPPTTPRAVSNYLHRVKADAKTAIEKQQQLEMVNLDSCFNKTDFVKNLTEALELADGEIERVKNEMVDTLKKAHKEVLGKFEQSLNESIRALHIDSQTEHDRVSYLATMYETDKKMRKIINDIVAARGEPPQATTATINLTENEAIFKGLSVKDLPIIYTMTGRPVSYDKKNDSFHMQLPKYGLFYYHVWQHKVEKDLTSMANTVKAAGHTSITMNINYKDPKKAEELGRRAYEASIRAGFAPKDIHIKVNGKEMTTTYGKDGKETPGELFKGYSTREQIANTMAEKIAAETKHARAPSAVETHEQDKAIIAGFEEFKNQNAQIVKDRGTYEADDTKIQVQVQQP